MMTPTIDERGGMALHEPPERGSGPAVLWIHGYSLDSTVWDDLWALLPDFRHIGVDLAGHGRSRRLCETDTLPGLGRTIAQIAAERDVDHLVGMSFGGMLALQAAIEAIRPFQSLALGSTALGGGPTDRDATTRNLQLIQLYRERGPGPWLCERWMQWPPDIFKGASGDPVLWNKLVHIIGRHSFAELSDTSMGRLTSHVQSPYLKNIHCPTLVIIGDNDMAAFKRAAQLVQRALPQSRREYLPATGHLSLLEHPAVVAPLLVAHWQAAARSSVAVPTTRAP